MLLKEKNKENLRKIFKNNKRNNGNIVLQGYTYTGLKFNKTEFSFYLSSN